MNYREFVDDYIQSKSLAWAPNTLRSEMYRLRGVAVHMGLGPDALYAKLTGTKEPYTIKTIFIRVGEFYQWLMINGKVAQGENPFKSFMLTNARLFKHAFQKKDINVTYEEAVSRIAEIKDRDARSKASQLLASGQRYEESFSSQGGYIIGKGGKPRRDFTPKELKAAANYKKSYDTFRRKLKEVGLKPHTLRKLAATRLGAQGASEADLLKIFGWSNIQTASNYLQPLNEDKLDQMIKKASKVS